MMYFSLTILSTVGYGDFFPISPNEMIFTAFIMLMGVAVFSWIMGEIGAFMQASKGEDNFVK